MKEFEFAADEIGLLNATIAPGTTGGGIGLDEGTLRVEYGDPPSFSIAIPRDLIVSVDRRPDLPGRTRGIHGRRGSWLVNRSGEGLVRITLRRSVSAALKPSRAVDSMDEVRGALGKVVRFLTRDRTIDVRELTVAVSEPDEFVQALRPA